jgi:hypothetical protein
MFFHNLGDRIFFFINIYYDLDWDSVIFFVKPLPFLF